MIPVWAQGCGAGGGRGRVGIVEAVVIDQVADALRAACPSEEECFSEENEDECWSKHPIHYTTISNGIITNIEGSPEAIARVALQCVRARLLRIADGLAGEQTVYGADARKWIKRAANLILGAEE